MDLSFCSQKPWNIMESDTELLHCSRTDLTDRNLDLTWTKAVRDWHTISKSVGDASSRSAIERRMSCDITLNSIKTALNNGTIPKPL